MTTENQEKALRIFKESNKYYVSAGEGKLYSYRRKTDTWEPVTGNKLKYGYNQVTLYAGRGKKEKINVYLHVLVWIVTYGTFDGEKLKVKHKNGIIGLNAANNLYLDGDVEDGGSVIKYVPRKIKEKEIEDIKALVIAGMGPSAIAQKLNLNVDRVGYAVRKIKKGDLMRFDERNPGAGKASIQKEPIFKLPE